MKTTYVNKIIQHFGNEILQRSSLLPRYPEEYLDKLMIRLRPSSILEIGTWNGITTGYFARFEFVKEIITIDISKITTTEIIWKNMIPEFKHKIKSIIIKNNLEKKEVLKNKSFDLGFIDGDHTYNGVKSDFEIIKDKSEHILFHDYASNNHVTKFILELTNVIEKRADMGFALWKNN